MSRIGKQPVKIPSGVKVDIKPGLVSAQGPKGKIEQPVHPDMTIKVDKDSGDILVTRPSDLKRHKADYAEPRLFQPRRDVGARGYRR